MKENSMQSAVFMKTTNFNTNKSRQAGVGLIEVLVSIILLGISVLGFTALQARSVSSTSESLSRSNALNIVGDLIDRVRLNPTAESTYTTKLNAYNTSFHTNGTATAPTKTCGLFGAATACNARQQADADAYDVARHAYAQGIKINIATCPGTGATSIISTCVISAWGETEPTVGSAGTNCVNTDGDYVSDATCMLMEMF